MATEDEAREAADGTEVQVEAVDFGTVHFQAHPEVKLPSIMDIKNVGESIDSTEGTLTVPEDEVLVEAPSAVELPPEHHLNGKASSLNGPMDQAQGIKKAEVTDGLSHGESTTEDRSLLKHEKDEEPKDDQQDSEGVTVDDDLVEEDTLKTESSIEQTDDGQQDQNQEPKEANEDTQPASIINNADVDVVAKAPAGLQTPVEPQLDDSDQVPGTINELQETDEPTKADGVAHPDHNESFPEDTSIAEPTEEVVKVDQQSQQADAMDADVVQEEMLIYEETDVQEVVPKSEHADDPATDAHEVLNQESTEETDGPVDEKIEETEHESKMAAPKETIPEHDTITRESPVDIQVQNQESLEEIENAQAVDPETAMQQSIVGFEEAIPEDQHNLGIRVDDDTVQENTLEAIDQTEDGQQDHDVGPEKAIEDTQPASIQNIPDVAAVAEAPSGVQTPLEINLDNSDTVPDTADGKEIDESAKADGVINPDQKEGFSEDTSIAESTEEVVKVEDEQSQSNAMDEDVVKEELTKSEHVDEPATDAQESADKPDGPVNENTEETEQESKIAAPEETTPEHDALPTDPPINQESLQEIEDAEVEMQENSVTFEETIPEDHVATTEPGSEIQHVHRVEPQEISGPGYAKDEEITNKSNIENAVQDNILQSGPTADIQPIQELEQTESTGTETYEMDEASDQTHAVVLNDLDQEDATETSEQVTETEELKDTEASEAQEFTEQGYATPSKELSTQDHSTADEPHNDDFLQTLEQDSVEVKETISTSEGTMEENVTAEEPTCDSQEVDNSESTEEIKGIIGENISEVSDVVLVDKAVEEQNVLGTEDVAETDMRELEPEETNNTEPVETEEPSEQRNSVLFDDSAQGDNTLESDMQQTESATETTETEAAPQESEDCVSEEPDSMIESETNCDTQVGSTTESLEVIDGDKYIITAVSGQNMASAGESAQENNVTESKTSADIQSVQEQEPEEIENTEPMEVKETSDENNTAIFPTPTEEDNPATVELHESARDLTNIEAAEAGTPHQSGAAQSEEQAIEKIAGEPESVEEMNDTEATELQHISQDNIISTSGESVPEEIATEGNSTTEPEVDRQKLQDQESADFKEIEADKPEGISTSEQSTSKDNATATEPTSDTQSENLNPTEVNEGTEDERRNAAVAEAAAPEEHEETDATADTSPVQEPEPNVDDQQVDEDKVPEDSEAMEADEVIAIPDDATAERSELRSEPDSYVEPAQQVELSRDSESIQLVKAEETSGQVNAVAIEETRIEDLVASEIDPPADIKQEHEQEPVEEIKGIDANEAEEEFHTSQVDAMEKPASEGTIASTEPTSNIKQENELEATKEINDIEAIDDGEQTENATSENQSPTDNETTPEGHSTELNEETMENETDNVVVPEIKDETQTSAVLKGDACDLGETVITTQESENVTDEDAIQSSGDDILETSNNVDQVKEEQKDATATEPTSDTQSENLNPTEVNEGTEDERSNAAVAEAAAPEEHEETDATADTSPVQEPEPNVDDQQVDEDKVPEDSEAMEADEVIAIPDDATEERSELRSDLDSYVEPAQQVELSRDSESIQLVKAEETSGQVNAVTIEETHIEDLVGSEIDPPVDTKQEHEQEPVEEIKGIDANEAEEEFQTSQVDAMEKPASEGTLASTEPTSNIRQENELEATKEISDIEANDDGEQTENATSEDQSPTDNETTPEGHPTELNEETMENETDNVVVPEIKHETQTSAELKGDACDLGETVITTQESENVTDEDAIQSSGDDISETSNNVDQVKEGQKDGCENNSNEMSGAQNEENAIHVHDRDISGQLLTERGTEEASQALFESDPRVAEDVTEKDDTAEGGEQTSDLNMQLDDVALQLQTCEADDLPIGRQDEVAQKDGLDQQQKKDEGIESQKEELQADEQKHEDKGDELVEPQDIENGPTNKTEDTDACEAEQTEAVITAILKHEEAPHVSEDSTPSKKDTTVDSGRVTDEGTEEANAKNDNKDDKESAEKDAIVAKGSTDEQDGTTDEITNEELEPGLALSGQEASDPAPSNNDVLVNDPEAVTQNVESGEHIEDKECTDKVNDDLYTIQASEEDIAEEIKENEEIRNEENVIHHDESHKKPEEEGVPQLHSNEPCDIDGKVVDTTTLGEEIVDGNANLKPREIEEIGENKGLDSTPEPFVESSIQNIVEQDLSSHHKVEDEKLSMTEKNNVDIEGMQEKADESASDINQAKHCQEEINTDDVQQLEIEENPSDKIDEAVSREKTETSTTEAVTTNDNITDKASGANGGPSDGSIKTYNDTGRDLDASSVITASKEEDVNENMDDQKVALPAHDETTPEQVLCLEKTERKMASSEKLLPVEPEENQILDESSEKELDYENQIPNENNEEDMQEQDAETGDAQKDVEQDLPVSHFLMNLILGKKNDDANENSEPEAERKQGETTEDDSCVHVPEQEESLGPLSTENKVDDNVILEQEKHDVKCSGEIQEMVKEKSDDLKLDIERSINTDEEFNKNTRDLEIPSYQGKPQDKIPGELLSEEAGSVSTKMETRDIEISDLDLEDKAVDTVYQENTEASTKDEKGSLDLTNTKASEEDTPGEGQTGLQQESLPEDKTNDAVHELMPLTESGMIDSKDLSCGAEAVQNLACAKKEEPNESSITEDTITPDIQLECDELEKKEEEHHASMATGEVSQDNVEGSDDNLQKSTSSEVTSDEQAPQITEPVNDTEKILAHEKEICEGSTCMDEKEISTFSIKGAENFQTAVEIQADGPNMQTNQDKKDEVADNKTATEPEKLRESDFQDHQEPGTEQKSPKAIDEADKEPLVEKETIIKEQVVPGTVESHEQTLSIKSNEEQELFDSKVQERDLNVVSPRDASETEENFVDVTKPEFSTDEEQSPKAGEEEKTYDENIQDVDGTKNSTDGAAMKTEAPGATQKAQKKHNLLSGVGSKVKHQLAKVKKAIVGKPGHAKLESPKS